METAPQNEPTRPEKTLPRSWWRRYRRLLIIVGVTLLITVGGNALWIVTHLPPPRPPQGLQCGNITRAEYTPRVPDGPASVQIIRCFWSAYQRCQAATMNVSFMGDDAGEGYTITIEKSGQQCLIYTDIEVDNNNGKVSDDIFLCNSMTHQANELQVSGCGNSSPYGIAPLSINPRQCGVVSNTSSRSDLAQAEDCFWRGYNSCNNVELAYVIQHGTVVDTRHFGIDINCHVTYQHGGYTAICEHVASQEDGLHFFLCGKEKDVLVPLPPGQ
ncbi:MAG: hypothetical protein M3Z08_06755 [Chloroflexota bacterium]|nr:hypothetical protein [Chloroflexota bacterium]